MTVLLDIAADGDRPALRLRPWLAADMPDLLAAMGREYPDRGLSSKPDVDIPGPQRWTGPRGDAEIDVWLSGQRRGWHHGDWLSFAVLDAARNRAVGHVALRNRDGGGVGTGERGEISYWTAADARGRGIAPAAVRAVTDWAFSTFGPDGLPRIMLVHDLDNPASCRVAAKSGYPFHEFSPANPPYWFTDGHIHVAEAMDYHYPAQRITTTSGMPADGGDPMTVPALVTRCADPATGLPPLLSTLHAIGHPSARWPDMPDRVALWWAIMRTSSSRARVRPLPSWGCW